MVRCYSRAARTASALETCTSDRFSWGIDLGRRRSVVGHQTHLEDILRTLTLGVDDFAMIQDDSPTTSVRLVTAQRGAADALGKLEIGVGEEKLWGCQSRDGLHQPPPLNVCL